jgi:ligand-binding SRPBCC domain-containing protein
VGLIQLETAISASAERCFDLSLSVQLHVDSAAKTRERVVDGPRAGLLGLGDTITWEARHLGFRKRLSVAITAFERPHRFRDEMTDGPLRHMRHDHRFEPVGDGTLMHDSFEVSMLPLFDPFVLLPHLRRFLRRRNETIKRVAESNEWQRYLG